MNEVDFDGNRPIDGYGPGFFRIGGALYKGNVLVSPSGIASWEGYEDLAVFAGLEIDVLLLGTGPEIAHAPPAVRAAVEEAGLGLEVMASPAACRTYNVLIAEGRRVGAALLVV